MSYCKYIHIKTYRRINFIYYNYFFSILFCVFVFKIMYANVCTSRHEALSSFHSLYHGSSTSTQHVIFYCISTSTQHVFHGTSSYTQSNLVPSNQSFSDADRIPLYINIAMLASSFVYCCVQLDCMCMVYTQHDNTSLIKSNST